MSTTNRFVAAVRAVLSLVIAGIGLLLVSAAMSSMFTTPAGDLISLVIGLALLYLGGRLAVRWGRYALRGADTERPRPN